MWDPIKRFRKPSQQDIVDAIVVAVTTASAQVEPGKQFCIRLSAIPDFDLSNLSDGRPEVREAAAILKRAQPRIVDEDLGGDLLFFRRR